MKNRKGIILAGGSGTRLYPITKSVSKQLLPVYDKPMIYYPLSILMLGDIRDILIISTPRDLPSFENLFKDGSQLGLNINYAEQREPNGLAEAFIIGESFLNGAPTSLVLGDNLFFGGQFIQKVKAASHREDGATIFGYRVANPEDYGVVEFDADNNVVSLEEKPSNPKSNFAIPGLYFYDEQVVELAKDLQPSARGELEITDLNSCYLHAGALKVELLGRGTAWLDTGEPDALLEAAHFVQTIQRRTNLQIANLEEIAFSKQWISQEQLLELAEMNGKTNYNSYLKQLVDPSDWHSLAYAI